MPATAPNNPVSEAPNGGVLGGFFRFVAGLAQPVITAKVDYEAQKYAARTQQMLNRYHQADPSLGPNDPRAAQVAENRSFLERFLPTSMLYTTSAAGVRTPTGGYYVVMGLLLVAAVLVLRRLWK